MISELMHVIAGNSTNRIRITTRDRSRRIRLPTGRVTWFDVMRGFQKLREISRAAGVGSGCSGFVRNDTATEGYKHLCHGIITQCCTDVLPRSVQSVKVNRVQSSNRAISFCAASRSEAAACWEADAALSFQV